MYYCVVYYPKIDTSKIDLLRQKYDPSYGAIKPHMTLVFPINADLIKSEDIIGHVSNIAKAHQPFKINLSGLEKSWDNWLFLGVNDGRDYVVSLHDELYTGPLEPHWRKDLPFSPHISLGLFNKEGSSYSLKNPEIVAFNNEKYDQALREAKEANLDYQTNLDILTLIKLDNNLSEIVESTDFPLK